MIKKYRYKNTAFVIGNGESRKDFDLLNLKGIGAVFGCNALYRDFAPDYELPDYIVSVDDIISHEIVQSDFPRQRHLRVEGQESTEYPYSHRRNNAGMVAMKKAIKRGFVNIVCLGFDFIIDGELEVSNLYDGTNGYGQETRTSKNDNHFRLQYLEWFANEHSNVRFTFVFPEKVNKFKTLDVGNVSGVSYRELHEIIK
jgi:hypothetical protein